MSESSMSLAGVETMSQGLRMSLALKANSMVLPGGSPKTVSKMCLIAAAFFSLVMTGMMLEMSMVLVSVLKFHYQTKSSENRTLSGL